MLANSFSTSKCFAIFELIKFMCFGSTHIYRTKNFSSRARPAPAASSTRARPAAASTRTRTQSSAGSRTRPANAGTRNPRGLTRSAQDSSTYSKHQRIPEFVCTFSSHLGMLMISSCMNTSCKCFWPPEMLSSPFILLSNCICFISGRSGHGQRCRSCATCARNQSSDTSSASDEPRGVIFVRERNTGTKHQYVIESFCDLLLNSVRKRNLTFLDVLKNTKV